MWFSLLSNPKTEIFNHRSKILEGLRAAKQEEIIIIRLDLLKTGIQNWRNHSNDFILKQAHHLDHKIFIFGRHKRQKILKSIISLENVFFFVSFPPFYYFPIDYSAPTGNFSFLNLYISMARDLPYSHGFIICLNVRYEIGSLGLFRPTILIPD